MSSGQQCPYDDGSEGNPSPGARAMTVARNVAEALEETSGSRSSASRMDLNLYQPLPQTPGGAARCVRNMRGNSVPSTIS